jgi:hypothetical protein
MTSRGAVAVLLAAFSLLPLALANHVQTDSGKAIVFDHWKGNEWWVEVHLSGQDAGSVAKVEAMDDGGPWVAMTSHPEWGFGDWAASFHIEAGHRVQFRASWAGGAQQVSCWFTHPAGVEQCGTSSSSSTTTSPPPPPAFDATWSNVKGNEWWVEAVIKANTPIYAVLLDICGSGMESADMTYHADWGKWTLGNTHIPAGSTIVMTAIGDGGSDASGGYVWPQATPTTGCAPPPPAFAATFTNVKGNDWWVEAKATGTEPIAGVDARVGCDSGPWTPLTLRSWGSWAASFHVVPGSHVDFRAHASSGATDLSDHAYVWPAATPTDACDHPWPRASSFADVRFRDNLREFDSNGAETYTEWDGLVHAYWTGTAWDGTCEQRVSRMDASGAWSNVTEHYQWDTAPPMGQVPATVGGVADLQTASSGCSLSGLPDQPVTGRETRTFSIRSMSGDFVPIDAYHASDSSTGGFSDEWWDAQHGLMLQWDSHSSSQFHSSNRHGWLLNTDARFA